MQLLALLLLKPYYLGMDIRYLLTDMRARIYLLWAILGSGGFLATHYYQNYNINILWAIIAAVGLGYMYRVIPLGVRQMRHIFLAWLIPVAFGMVVSGGIFYIATPWAAYTLAHLGGFWLVVMAAGYFLTGLIDNKPAFWYWFAFVLNGIAAALCFISPLFTEVQYLVAAVVTAWSMLNLWLFRSSAS